MKPMWKRPSNQLGAMKSHGNGNICFALSPTTDRLFILIGFTLLSAKLIGFRRLVAAGAISFFILTFFLLVIWDSNRDLNYFIDDLISSGGALWSSDTAATSTRDIDRYLQIRVAWTCITEDFWHFTVGYGYRMSGYVIGEHLLDLISIYTPEKLLKLTSDYSNVGTEAFSAFAIDTGFIGILLITSLFGITGVRIFRAQSRLAVRLILCACVVVIFSWMFVIDFRDVVLFYLCMMPNGILIRLSEAVLSRRVDSESELRGMQPSLGS